MSISEFSIISGGVLSLALAFFHSRLYVRFDWKSEFEKIQVRNKRIFYTLNFALILLFAIFALLSFIYFKELGNCTGLALGVNLLYSLFWLWRAIWQIYYFKAKTTLHYVMILIFSLLFIAYALPVFLKI
jgi:hypothetical protein